MNYVKFEIYICIFIMKYNKNFKLNAGIKSAWFLNGLNTLNKYQAIWCLSTLIIFIIYSVYCKAAKEENKIKSYSLIILLLCLVNTIT